MMRNSNSLIFERTLHGIPAQLQSMIQYCICSPTIKISYLQAFPCMADPDVDHGFLYDEQGLVDILQSPFFDPNPEVDDTIDDYIEHIIFTLAPSIEEYLPTGSWRIIGHPSTSPPPATSPTNNTLPLSSTSQSRMIKGRNKALWRKEDRRERQKLLPIPNRCKPQRSDEVPIMETPSHGVQQLT
ncbi:hypothetical protein M5K25_016391 [Dendrobium thyrsiflorum]|uniref:Uncharacterized protein n=1 Tax=Dendrobium thyrsiflorum TaxID=117978 RepID=A0ABD0URE1_DENTH